MIAAVLWTFFFLAAIVVIAPMLSDPDTTGGSYYRHYNICRAYHGPVNCIAGWWLD